MRKQIWFVLLMLVLMTVSGAQAQGAPEPINDALAALSAQVGRTVTVNDLSWWMWRQEVFPDASLGCPKEGQTYAQVLTTAYVFELTYNGIVYDYRVPLDRTGVILCSQRDANAPTPTPPLEEQYSNTLCPPPEAGKPPYMRTRLVAGVSARVIRGYIGDVRQDARQDAPVATQIPGGADFEILAGPLCYEGALWWQTVYNGITGWVQEGQDGAFFIEPKAPNPLPPLVTITADNAAALSELAQLAGNLQPALDFSPDSNYLAVVGGRGSEGVWLYNTAAVELPPRIIEGEDLFTTIEYSANGERLLLGAVDGSVRLWNVAADARLRAPLFLNSHMSNISAARYAPDNFSFAVAGQNALSSYSFQSETERANAILVWDVESVSQQSVLVGHTGTVTDMAYYPAGGQLISVSEDGSIRIWDILLRTPRLALNIGVPLTAVAYRFDGAIFAVGQADGVVGIYANADGQTFITQNAHAGAVNDVAFNSDGTLLATVGDDGTLRVWNALRPDSALATIQVAQTPLESVAFSPNGQLIAVAAENKVYLYGLSNDG